VGMSQCGQAVVRFDLVGSLTFPLNKHPAQSL
jgi:hypothetical protein